MEEEIDEGLKFIENWVANFKGKNVCANCGRKLGVFGWKEIYLRFGLTKRLCKSCFKEYKTHMKTKSYTY
jgi:hypothetical protein